MLGDQHTSTLLREVYYIQQPPVALRQVFDLEEEMTVW
jgi:hypothetical protein